MCEVSVKDRARAVGGARACLLSWLPSPPVPYYNPHPHAHAVAPMKVHVWGMGRWGKISRSVAS